jgi:hypothetical protein
MVHSSESSVGIAMVYGLHGRGSTLSKGKKYSSSPQLPSVLGPTQPPIQWVPWAVSPGVKQLGFEADLSPSFSVKFKNSGTLPTLLHTPSWRGAKLIKQRNNFNFTAVVTKSYILWNITPCCPLKVNRRFGGRCHLHLYGRRISQTRKQHNAGSKIERANGN